MLFVAGEASGDRIAAAILEELGVPAFGMGGEAASRAGGELVADLRDVSAVGALDVLARAPRLAAALARLAREVRRRRPRAAVLVDFTELNARIGRWLRRLGVPVLWCVAPQVWAWRPARAATLGSAMDRLAVLFSFEVPLWRRHGVDARWVGHPSLDGPTTTRPQARAALGIHGDETLLGLLPGSRRGEVSRQLPAMLAAARDVGARAVTLLSPSLDAQTATHARALAVRAGVETFAVDARTGLRPLLPAFDAAMVSSGTATLETALAGVPPVVCYRLDPVAAAIARRLVATPHIALPNVLLGRRAYPELLQDEVTPRRLARATDEVLSRPRASSAAIASELRAIVDMADGSTMGARAASLVRPWL